MVNVDSLSDAELRTKLIEYGFPVMPITGTTRKVMVKKLKLLMENKNKITSDNRRSLSRYSSEEESDTDLKVKEKNRRATMAAPSRPAVALRKSVRVTDNDINDISQSVPKDVVKTTKHVTTTKSVTVLDDFDTGSDSEPEVVENNDDSFDYRDSPARSTFSPSSPFRFRQSTATKYSPPKTVSSSTSLTNFASSSLANKPVASSPRFTSAYVSNDADALDRLNQIRSRLSLGNTSGLDRSSYSSTPLSEKKEEKTETPFLSNFTRRLSQLSSPHSPKSDYDLKNDIIKEYDTNGAGGYNRNYLGRTATNRYRDANLDYYSRHDSNIVKNNMVSLAVIGLACLFFVVVGMMYYGMHKSGDNALDVTGYFIPRCATSDMNAKPGLNCIHDEDIEGAITLMRILKSELHNIAISFVCHADSVTKPYMTEPEVISYKHKLTGQDVKDVQRDLQNLEVLIFKNPEWGISLIQKTGDTVTEQNVLSNMDEVISYRPSKVIGLMVFNPAIPITCRFYNKMYAIFNTLFALLGGFLLLYMANLAYKYLKRYQQEKKDEIFNMVERIVDALQSNSTNEGGENFLVINHVRDMILPIIDRKRLEGTWEEAVKFLNEHESRVRTEVQVVQGEPFEVWRWLGSPNLNTSGSPRSKTWQGQAFETQVGSVNSLPCSPTPCLKIRGMVEDNESNSHTIREAVLSKCADRCRILHCAIDNATKCVYLKCADQKDAAVAYTNLHGWWYAGHLVTVKYLRLERYMQRFPDSPLIGPPYLKSMSPSPSDWTS